MRRFDGKVILITGASSGIGAALAREFSSRGAKVCLAARRVDRLESLAQDIRAKNGDALVLQVDVTQSEDLTLATSTILKKFGRLDVVVANAGFGVIGKFQALKIEDYQRQFETNVWGVIKTVHATVRALETSKGSLLIVGSVMGYLSVPGASAYSMSKHALKALAEALDYELKPNGVNVKYIAPGFVESEIRKVDNKGDHVPEAKESIPRWILVPANKAAHDIANAVFKRRREVVITGHGKILAFLNQHFPSFYSWLIQRVGYEREKDFSSLT